MGRLLFTLILLATTGCGYTTGSLLPSKFQTIYVDNFKNEVTSQSRDINYVPLLEVKVRDAVVNRFLFEGHLRIGKEETSDLILRGSLKGFERQELRVTDNQNVQEFRVNIFVDLELWDPVDQKIVWTETNFTGEATYFVTGPQATSENEAIAKALNDLSRRVVERTLEDW